MVIDQGDGFAIIIAGEDFLAILLALAGGVPAPPCTPVKLSAVPIALDLQLKLRLFD